MQGEHSGQKCFSKWQGGVLSTHSTPYIGKSTESKCFSPALTRLRRASPRYAQSTSPLESMINFQAPAGVHVHVCIFYPYKWQLHIYIYIYILKVQRIFFTMLLNLYNGSLSKLN